ncbi:MAG: hypothetical protein HY288_04870 [Planctomycetia bacterium]|nr:hypothetical protein [Planctomycetia bacterium]
MIRSVACTFLPAIGRRLFVLPCLLALGAFGGCGGMPSAEQKEAMAKIQDLGGRVNFKRGGYEVDLNKSAVENKDLAQLAKIPNLKTVDLDSTRVGDEGLHHLEAISSLEFVSVRRTAVTREGIANLKKALPNAEVNH